MLIEICEPREIRSAINKVKEHTAKSGNIDDTASGNANKRCLVASDLSIVFSCLENNEIASSDLAFLVSNAPGYLQSFNINCGCITGDISGFLVALKSRKAQMLESFTFYKSCGISKGDMAKLGHALAQLPRLNTVILSFPTETTVVTLGETLLPLFKRMNSALKAISLFDFGVSPENPNEIKETLSLFGSYKNLENLTLEPLENFDSATLHCVAKMMRACSSLRSLSIRVMADMDLSEIAHAMRECPSMTYLSIDTPRSRGESSEIALANFSAFSSVLREDCFKMLRFNLMSSDYLCFFGTGALAGGILTCISEICHFLMLNKLGRGKLLVKGTSGDMPTTDDWFGVISDEDDVSVVYYFLRKNPSLCLPGKDSSIASSTESSQLPETASSTKKVWVLVDPSEICDCCKPKIQHIE